MSLEALQRCLAGEHAAVYGYGVIGGVLAGASTSSSRAEVVARAQQLAAAGYVAHRRRRDQLTGLITAQGGTPVAAAPAYDLPGPVRTLDQCRALAIQLEDRCAQIYADAVARTTDHDRAFTARALTGCALGAASWGAKPDPFPGLAEF